MEFTENVSEIFGQIYYYEKAIYYSSTENQSNNWAFNESSAAIKPKIVNDTRIGMMCATDLYLDSLMCPK